MKFVMFPEGVAFFPNALIHDNFRLITAHEKAAKPIAAGFVFLKQPSNGDAKIEHLVLAGHSISLGIDAQTAYPDWLNRHERSGLSPQCKLYNQFYKVFFFPFEETRKFVARGIGFPTEPTPTTSDEFVVYIRQQP